MSPSTEGLSSGLAPTPSFVIPAMYPIFIYGLTFTSRIIRSVFFVALLSIAIFVVLHSTTGDPSTDYLYATIVSSLVFQSLDYLVISDPYTEFSLVDQPPSLAPSTLPFFSRLKWCAKLAFSPRGVGWKHEPKSVLPPHPSPQSRLHFIFIRQLPSAFPLLLLADLGNLLVRSHPAFLPNGPSLSSVGPIMRYLNLLIFALPSYCTLQLIYIISSIIFTSLHLYSPQDFPSYIGSWGDAYTIRRFWGRAWHQVMRRWVSAPISVLENIDRVLHLWSYSPNRRLRSSASNSLSYKPEPSSSKTVLSHWGATSSDYEGTVERSGFWDIYGQLLGSPTLFLSDFHDGIATGELSLSIVLHPKRLQNALWGFETDFYLSRLSFSM